MSITWILIADRTKAKLLHVLPHGQGPFPELASLIHEAGRLQARERDSSEPGRVIHPAGYASAVEPHEDRDHVESKRFAAEIVHHLDHCRQESRFDQLIVVAPPKFLGVLRDAWTPLLRRMVQLEVHQDLMTISATDLQRRLEELVAGSLA
ncbi:MAG: host attachment protein [Planctomycetaceae bacterium]